MTRTHIRVKKHTLFYHWCSLMFTNESVLHQCHPISSCPAYPIPYRHPSCSRDDWYSQSQILGVFTKKKKKHKQKQKTLPKFWDFFNLIWYLADFSLLPGSNSARIENLILPNMYFNDSLFSYFFLVSTKLNGLEHDY